MGKFLRSLTDGTLRCRYCGDGECNCMEDGQTELTIIAVWIEKEHATLVQFRKQVLPNGKKIPSGYKVWIKKKSIYGIDAVLKTILIDNDQINRLVFDN